MPNLPSNDEITRFDGNGIVLIMRNGEPGRRRVSGVKDRDKLRKEERGRRRREDERRRKSEGGKRKEERGRRKEEGGGGRT
jgi:hypothetical protein